MKKRFIFLFLILVLLLTSCQMEEAVPDQGETLVIFTENEELYRRSVDFLCQSEFDCMISRTDYYAPDGSEDLTGLYMQNMQDSTFTAVDDPTLTALFTESTVKLVDFMKVDDLLICTFDMCIPGHNFDYGIYYVSVDEPVFFGDPAITLVERENGYAYEKQADYGVKFTYYTEKITENFYYYEII